MSDDWPKKFREAAEKVNRPKTKEEQEVFRRRATLHKTTGYLPEGYKSSTRVRVLDSDPARKGKAVETDHYDGRVDATVYPDTVRMQPRAQRPEG